MSKRWSRRTEFKFRATGALILDPKSLLVRLEL